MNQVVNEGQGVLQPPRDLIDTIYAADGVVRLEDLDWPNFDPERALTMSQYLGEIGARLADSPRENPNKDSALHVFRDDFTHAKPDNLRRGLWGSRRNQRPGKTVLRVRGPNPDLDMSIYTGVVPLTTGVAVSEDLYSDVIGSPEFYTSNIANRTERSNREALSIEEGEDLGGESAVYAMSEAHQLLEWYDQTLVQQRSELVAVYRNLVTQEPRRIKNLESYRLGMNMAVQEMARIACKNLYYGTNSTQNTLLAIVSNVYRSPERDQHLLPLLVMAIGYNDAVRGKLNTGIQAVFGEIDKYKEALFNNIDREYEDKPKKRKSTTTTITAEAA
jgi:hypothetical protein